MKYNESKHVLLAGALLVITMINAMPAAAMGSNVVNIGDNITATRGNNITVPVSILNATGVGGVGIKLSYNASVVNVTGATQGDFPSWFAFDSSNASNGWIRINTYIMDAQLTGNLTIGNVTLEAIGNPGEQSLLNLEILAIANKTGYNLPASTDNGSFIVISTPPVLDPIGNRSVNEGSLLGFTVSATDPDGDSLTYSALNLPAGAGFNAAARTFSWTPGYDQSGSYPNVQFRVSDGTLVDTENITITVNNVNRAPVLDLIGNKSVNEGQTLNFIINAADPDGDSLTYSALNLPAGASFNAAARTFSWTPGYDQSGSYPNVQFRVSDGTLVDTENITITVNNVNRAPSIGGLVNQSGKVGNAWTYNISAFISDPDGDQLTITTSDSNVSVTGFVLTFNYSVAVNNKSVLITVSDGSLSGSQAIFVTAVENSPPLVTNPTSSQLIPDDTDNIPSWGETSTLNITVTDGSGIASVTVNLSAIGGSQSQPMVNMGGNIWSVTTNAPAGTPPQTYYLKVNATDIHGNSNNTASIPLVVMRNGDTNGNDIVNIVDAMLLSNYVSYSGQYSISSVYVADVTGDSNINIADAMLLANYVSYPGYILS